MVSLNSKTIIYKRPWVLTIITFFIAVTITLIATGSNSGPIKMPLSTLTCDFIIFTNILDSTELYSGLLYLTMAKQAAALTFPISLCGFLERNGLSLESQFVIFYLLQTLIGITGFMLLAFRLRGSLLTALAGLSILMISAASPFFTIRVLGSSLSTAIAFFILAFLVQGRYLAASVIAGLSGYIHPTYPFVYQIIVIFVQITDKKLRYLDWHKLLKNIGVFCIVLFPLFVKVLWNINLVLQTSSEKDLWVEFIRLVNNLTFPLERGVSHVIGYVTSFIVSAAIYFHLDSKNPMYRRLGYVLIACTIAYAVQVLFADIFPIDFIIRLALNHRVNGIALPLIILSVTIAMMNCITKSNFISWIFIVIFFIFFKESLSKEADAYSIWPDLFSRETFVRADLIVPALATLALLLLENKYQSKKWTYRLYSLGTCGFAIIISGFSAIIFQRSLYYLPGIAIVFGLLIRVVQWTNIYTKICSIKRYDYFTNLKLHHIAQKYGNSIISIVIILIVIFRLPFKSSLLNWRQYITLGKTESSALMNFIYKYVPVTERIIIVPLRGENRLSFLPTRITYIDSFEPGYILYLPGELTTFTKRLAPYSKNPHDKRDILLNPATWTSSIFFRKNIDLFRTNDPAANWVLTYRKYSCGNDQIYAEYVIDGLIDNPKNIILLKLEGIDRNCQSR